jgi:hypothetical protein
MKQKAHSTTTALNPLHSALSQLRALEEALQPFVVSADPKHAKLRLRRGYVSFVSGMAHVTATTPALSAMVAAASDVTQDASLIAELEPVAAELRLLSQRIEETIQARRTRSYLASLQAYGVAQKLATTDERLAKAIQPFEEFFKRHRRPGASTPPPPVVTPSH